MSIIRKLLYLLVCLLEFILENPIITVGVFWILIICVVIIRIKQALQFLKLNKALRKNPSNENIKAYTAFIKRISVPNHPKNWQALRQTYYIVKDLDHIDYDLRVELCEVLRKKGTSGVHPPRQYHYKSKEERIKNAGQEGEKQLTYALKWLDKNKFKVFNNIKLSDGGEAQEFDSIVIGDKAVFNIETKNYIGDLVIDEQGNWYRLVNGHKFGTENPIFQVKRHNRVLNNILGGGVPIVDLVVWSNLESIIEGAHYSPVKVIKLDQLTYFIESFNEGRNLTREEINLIIKRIEDSCSDYMANRS